MTLENFIYESIEEIMDGHYDSVKERVVKHALFICFYFHRPSGYLPCWVRSAKAATTKGLSAA